MYADVVRVAKVEYFDGSSYMHAQFVWRGLNSMLVSPFCSSPDQARVVNGSQYCSGRSWYWPWPDQISLFRSLSSAYRGDLFPW